jgi:hypothetical protein
MTPSLLTTANATVFIHSVLANKLSLTLKVTGVSKWAGTRYFYPPEIVYSTGRNY